jgi:multimeric flavodoxin WrbA
MQQIKRTQKQTKRTIHKTYTLGKSKTTRQIGVLIKDIETKHKINEATKNIKNTALHDMKVYLKNHNLIRVGSDAPPAVVKKLYESAVMSGDILNQNTEQMLVNLEAGDNV